MKVQTFQTVTAIKRRWITQDYTIFFTNMLQWTCLSSYVIPNDVQLTLESFTCISKNKTFQHFWTEWINLNQVLNNKVCFRCILQQEPTTKKHWFSKQRKVKAKQRKVKAKQRKVKAKQRKVKAKQRKVKAKQRKVYKVPYKGLEVKKQLDGFLWCYSEARYSITLQTSCYTCLSILLATFNYRVRGFHARIARWAGITLKAN